MPQAPLRLKVLTRARSDTISASVLSNLVIVNVRVHLVALRLLTDRFLRRYGSDWTYAPDLFQNSRTFEFLGVLLCRQRMSSVLA